MNVYVVAGGHHAFVFADEASALSQYTVMMGANIDTYATALTPERWELVRAFLVERNPEVHIIDMTTRDAGIDHDDIAAGLDATTPQQWAELDAELAHLERTDPAVAAAARRLDQTKQRILDQREANPE